MTPSGLLAAAAGLAVAAAFASSSLPVLGGALGAWRLASVIPRVWTAMGSGAFHKVDRDLYR